MLSLKFAGLELKNPFIIAAGPWSTDIGVLPKNIKRIAEAGWAGVTAKTVCHKDYPLAKAPYPHLFPISGKLSRMGMQNVGPSFTPFSAEKMKKAIKAVNDHGLVFIGSIIGETVNEWSDLAHKMEECGVDAVELDISCPVPIESMEWKKGVLPTYLFEEVVEVSSEVCNIPVIAKLSPNVYDLAPIAKACEGAGASAISAINTVLGLSGIDIETGVPLSSDINNRAIFSGLSGDLIRPIGLRCVAQIARAIKIPISGIGGITDYKSAVEYMMVGATTVQICTAVMWKGFGIAHDLIKGLTEFMNRKGYENINQLVGTSLQYITEDALHMNLTPALALIDETKCTGCGLCVTACSDGSHDAITIKDGIPVVDEDACVGCGLCKILCPIHCISIQARKTHECMR